MRLFVLTFFTVYGSVHAYAFFRARQALQQWLASPVAPGLHRERVHLILIDVVVTDNLAAYKVDGVRTRIEAAGAELRYLPPYSPDFNPIEKCWSQVKQRLRALQARSLVTLEQGLTEAPAVVTPQNIQAYFRHCGYSL